MQLTLSTLKLRRAYLNLVKKLKFDEEDCILGNDKKGELRCIFDLICHDSSAEFHLRIDQGICDFVKEWLTSEWLYVNFSVNFFSGGCPNALLFDTFENKYYEL